MRSVLGASLIFLVAACGTMKPSMSYRSEKDLPRMEVAANVLVKVAPVRPSLNEGESGAGALVAPELKPGDEVLLASSLKQALLDDLRAHGPVVVDPSSKTNLVFEIESGSVLRENQTYLWAFPPYIWPLVGMPAIKRHLKLSARARLLQGSVLLAEARSSAECWGNSGLYYGAEITFECAVEQLMDDLRSKLSAQAELIQRELAAARAVPPPPAPAPQPRPTAGAVLAVFDVEDASKLLKPSTMDQLSEYLGARVAETLRMRVIPRDQIRARLSEAKAASYEACYDQSCQIELGKSLAAEKSLATRLLRVGDTCAMTTTLFDLRTETAEKASSVRTECSDNALLGGLDRIVEGLAQ
jgi:hypothetical protein